MTRIKVHQQSVNSVIISSVHFADDASYVGYVAYIKSKFYNATSNATCECKFL